MNYKDYQNARNLSWEILIQERITELPAPIVALCQNLGIVVKYYDLTNGNDGECIISGGIPYISVNRRFQYSEKDLQLHTSSVMYFSDM